MKSTIVFLATAAASTSLFSDIVLAVKTTVSPIHTIIFPRDSETSTWSAIPTSTSTTDHSTAPPHAPFPIPILYPNGNDSETHCIHNDANTTRTTGKHPYTVQPLQPSAHHNTTHHHHTTKHTRSTTTTAATPFTHSSVGTAIPTFNPQVNQAAYNHDILFFGMDKWVDFGGRLLATLCKPIVILVGLGICIGALGCIAAGAVWLVWTSAGVVVGMVRERRRVRI